jgi:hypothetical protein
MRRNYAERYQSLLEAELNLTTEIYDDANGAYYVYSRKVYSITEAQQEFRRLLQYDLGKYMVGNVWALKRTRR